MKLFGLKDENGKEYVLNAYTIANGTSLYIETQVESIEPTPKFKIGDWVMCNRGCKVFKIIKIENNLICGTDFTMGSENFGNWEIRSLRLATASEIESHLIKEAERRGFVKGIKFKSIFSDKGAERKLEYFSSNQEEFKWQYLDNMDALYCNNGIATYHRFCSNPFIYRNGQWCPIVPDKKPLPKTKKDFMDFLGTYCNRHCDSVQKFLDDYED